ncbi:MAG: CsbD family protein [Acidiferrobacteraceae bacterium]
MNRDQFKGRNHEAEGQIKEVTGKVVGNKKLEEKGKVHKIAGKVQADYGDLKEDLKKGR